MLSDINTWVSSDVMARWHMISYEDIAHKAYSAPWELSWNDYASKADRQRSVEMKMHAWWCILSNARRLRLPSLDISWFDKHFIARNAMMWFCNIREWYFYNMIRRMMIFWRRSNFTRSREAHIEQYENGEVYRWHAHWTVALTKRLSL